jgi:Holliday junction resolvase RusA-like endonuclease
MHDSTPAEYRTLHLTVPGIARPKGSWAPRPNGSFRQEPKTTSWVLQVAAAARTKYPDFEPITGPVSVEILFVFPPLNRSTVGSRIFDYDTHPHHGDIDKLTRAMLDAINGKADDGYPLIADDRLVTSLTTSKVVGSHPGIHMRVVEVPTQWPMIGELDGPALWMASLPMIQSTIEREAWLGEENAITSWDRPTNAPYDYGDGPVLDGPAVRNQHPRTWTTTPVRVARQDPYGDVEYSADGGTGCRSCTGNADGHDRGCRSAYLTEAAPPVDGS